MSAKNPTAENPTDIYPSANNLTGINQTAENPTGINRTAENPTDIYLSAKNPTCINPTANNTVKTSLYIFFFFYGPPKGPHCRRSFGKVRPLR
jgi:hypothetical protein